MEGYNGRVLTNIPDMLDADGFIGADKKDGLVSAGVVPGMAHMTITASIPAGPTWTGVVQTPFEFSLNGKASRAVVVTYESAHTTQSFDLEFPIEAVRFPAFKQPQGASGTLQPPDPVLNEITVTHQGEADDVPAECGDHDSCGFWTRLQFDVVAPTVMIHGMTSDRRWYFKRNFVQSFQVSGKPFVVLPLTSGEKGSLGDGRIGKMADDIAPTLRTVADAFGADGLHLVGHSKGGLYGRQLVTKAAPATSGMPSIFTLTTLDTPHEGSPMADCVVAFDANLPNQLWTSGVWLDVFIYKLTHLRQKREAYDDLTVDKQLQYNASHSPLGDIRRFDDSSGQEVTRNIVALEAVASDAKDPQSNNFESSGYVNSLVARRMDGIFQRAKKIMFQYTAGKITGGTVVRPTGRVSNDLVVPTSSQQLSSGLPAGFQPLPSGQVLVHNHSTVGSGDVGSIVSQRLTVDRQQEVKR